VFYSWAPGRTKTRWKSLKRNMSMRSIVGNEMAQEKSMRKDHATQSKTDTDQFSPERMSQTYTWDSKRRLAKRGYMTSPSMRAQDRTEQSEKGQKIFWFRISREETP